MGFLDIRNVTKSYGSVQVLHEVDIQVQEGEFLVLVGPSGCGKSTLLNMIAGLEGITSGHISIKGRVMNGVHPSRRNIAMVFQSYALYPNMTVAQNMTFGLEMHGVPKLERDKALRDVGRLLQIENFLHRKPGQLSGGQRQRVAIAAALASEPELIIADEPVSALDMSVQAQILNLFHDLQQDLGAACIFITHDRGLVEHASNDGAGLLHGALVEIGTTEQVMRHPQHLYTRTLLAANPAAAQASTQGASHAESPS